MKLEIPAQGAEIKTWGPFILIDNEYISSVALSLPWPFRGVQIQILKIQNSEVLK